MQLLVLLEPSSHWAVILASKHCLIQMCVCLLGVYACACARACVCVCVCVCVRVRAMVLSLQYPEHTSVLLKIRQTQHRIVVYLTN